MPRERNGDDDVREGGEREPKNDDDLELVELGELRDNRAGDSGGEAGDCTVRQREYRMKSVYESYRAERWSTPIRRR
jgi:hypothetical protein